MGRVELLFNFLTKFIRQSPLVNVRVYSGNEPIGKNKVIGQLTSSINPYFK